MKPLFIIPARGGSKGIPHKNIKPLGGRPLIAYTLDVARELAPSPAHIFVSTDSDDIARVAEECGVPVPYRRPAYLSGDTASTDDAILDAMRVADEAGTEYDCVVLLQPTSPFRTADDVRATLARYTPDADLAVTVCAARTNPYVNCYETDADGYLHISKGDGHPVRRQDAPPVWEYNGAVYVINPESLRRSHMNAFTRRIPVEMPRERSLDLDTPLDWMVAEAYIAQQASR